jgi:hypothetical protein
MYRILALSAILSSILDLLRNIILQQYGMGFLSNSLVLLLSIASIANAIVLPRETNSTLPDSGCINSSASSCESNWDRIPGIVKAIIVIGAFLVFGVIAGIIHRFTTFTKSLLPSWMRSSRSQPLPPTQEELVMCWQRYGPKDNDGRPRAGSQRDLERVWKQSGHGMRMQLLAEGPRRGDRQSETAPFLMQGVRQMDPGPRPTPTYGGNIA